VKSGYRLFSGPVSGIRPDIRQVKSGIQPDTGFNKGRISCTTLVIISQTFLCDCPFNAYMRVICIILALLCSDAIYPELVECELAVSEIVHLLVCSSTWLKVPQQFSHCVQRSLDFLPKIKLFFGSRNKIKIRMCKIHLLQNEELSQYK
jgi:hypothetical protein